MMLTLRLTCFLHVPPLKSQVHTPVVEGDVTIGSLLKICMLISYIAFYYIKLYSLQEEYLPTDDATTEEEEEPAEEDIWKEKNHRV